MLRLAAGFSVGAIMANSSIDNDVEEWYQKDVRSSSTDDSAKIAKIFGEGKYLIPLTALSASLPFIADDSALGIWGEKSIRAYMVGAPAMLLMQKVTGASRPEEPPHDSRWSMFNDTNGVSGHAFIGAVPFLSIAKMNEDNKLIKYAAYAASAAGAWSRVNDDDHYLSQILLGWYMAWESVDAVFSPSEEIKTVSILPAIISHDAYGLSLQVTW